MTSATEPIATTDRDLDKLIAELDHEYTGNLPEAALREAQRRSEEVTPKLIELIRRATEAVRLGGEPASEGHVYALYLLTEFRAVAALPAILDAFSLPGEGPFELFGDSITEDGSRVLAALAVDRLDVIDGLIVNRSVNEYVRWEAAQTYLHLVRDGRMTRDEAVRRLGEHLRTAIANGDADLVTPLVIELASFAPHEVLPDIEDAYRRGLADESFIGLDDVHESLARGEAGIQEELDRCSPTGFEDTVEELKKWACYQEGPGPVAPTVDDDWTEDSGDWDEELDDLPEDDTLDAPGTIRYETPRVGRNDPCPCGSGRKFKKCCGKA